MVNMTSLADALTDSLPTRDDVIKAIGLATRRSAPVELASVIGVFGAGLLVGAGLALLFAPTTGEQMRRDLGTRLTSVRERQPSESTMAARSV